MQFIHADAPPAVLLQVYPNPGASVIKAEGTRYRPITVPKGVEMFYKVALAAIAATLALHNEPVIAGDGYISSRGPLPGFSPTLTGDFTLSKLNGRVTANLPKVRRAGRIDKSGSGARTIRVSRGGINVAPPAARPIRLGGASHLQKLQSLVAWAEAGPMGYDAVQYGARVKPSKRPTHMTLSEILGWVAATPGQPHAIGRYQIIPDTLRDLMKRTGLQGHTRFDESVQDRFARELMKDAGLDAYMGGRISRKTFMNNLAAIWAGLPNSSGRSTYHGHAGNAATISWAEFSRSMAQIFD